METETGVDAGATLWRMANRAVRVGVSLVLMIVLLALFLKGVDFAKVGQVLATADGPLLAAAVLVALFSYVLRALRWKFILLPVGRVRFSSVLITTAVGYAALSLLPARMGDLIRPILLARREKIPASASLASILTERVFDLWTVVFFFLIFIVWPPPMPNLDEGARHYLELLSLSGYVVGGGLVVGTLILLGLFRYQDRMVEVLTRPVGWIKESWKQPFANFCNHFLDGLRVLQRPRDLVITLVSSIVVAGSLSDRDHGGDRARGAHPGRRRWVSQGHPGRDDHVLWHRTQQGHRNRHRLSRYLLHSHHHHRTPLSALTGGQTARG
jgi:uncharacterized membrane protein YbhN (UPF0104 family)